MKAGRNLKAVVTCPAVSFAVATAVSKWASVIDASDCQRLDCVFVMPMSASVAGRMSACDSSYLARGPPAGKRCPESSDCMSAACVLEINPAPTGCDWRDTRSGNKTCRNTLGASYEEIVKRNRRMKGLPLTSLT